MQLPVSAGGKRESTDKDTHIQKALQLEKHQKQPEPRGRGENRLALVLSLVMMLSVVGARLPHRRRCGRAFSGSPFKCSLCRLRLGSARSLSVPVGRCRRRTLACLGRSSEPPLNRMLRQIVVCCTRSVVRTSAREPVWTISPGLAVGVGG